MANLWGNLTDGEIEALRPQIRTMSEEDIQERYAERDGRVVFRSFRKSDRAAAGPLDIDDQEAAGIGGYEPFEITLISPKEFDYVPELTAADREAARSIDAAVADLGVPFAREAGDSSGGVGEAIAELPTVIDHRGSQSPVKDQGGRGTCVSHASMAVLEAFPHIPDDLSEQYTHFKFNVFSGSPQNQDSGLKTTDAAPYLARNDGRICLEAEWPYIPQQATINQMVAAGTYAPPSAAVNHQAFGIGAYKIIEDKGLTGDSIKNTRYLEALLYLGYNIVVGVWASWDDKDNNGVLEPVLTSAGAPVGRGGHAMLIVGYDRTNRYFIIKNSWRNTWGHSGYGYFHYSFLESCAKYGFVVDTVVPAAPPAALPAKLASAPYNTAPLTRASLRAAVVFFRTSGGRYAVSEVYAGDNLYLRNLRVYNTDGSIHLERDTLVIRGTYLCDLDTGAETANDADFWWRAVSPGVNYLVPRNGAAAWIAFDLAAVTAAQIATLSMRSVPVPTQSLQYAVILGRTSSSQLVKLLAHAKSGNRLQLSYVEVFRTDGTRAKYGTSIWVPSSWTYDLDALQLSGGTNADLWWHVLADRVGFLEAYSTAQTRLHWAL
jgi:C1A family cysteine protease